MQRPASALPSAYAPVSPGNGQHEIEGNAGVIIGLTADELADF